MNESHLYGNWIIDDIVFEFLALHCGIGRGIKQRKSLKNNQIKVVNLTIRYSLLGSPYQSEFIWFFLQAILFIGWDVQDQWIILINE